VRAEKRAVGQVRLVLGQEALEAEQKRVIAPPLDRGLGAARVHLCDGRVERAAPGAAFRQRLARILSGHHEGLTRELFGAREHVAGNRRVSKSGACFSHVWAF
jgi:hypothetical protein